MEKQEHERLKELEQIAKDNYFDNADVNLVEYLNIEEQKEYNILFYKFCDWIEKRTK